MKRYLSGITLLLCSAVALTSCSDDDNPPIQPKLPAAEGASVTRITHSGNVPQSYDWSFVYANGRLTQGTGQLFDVNQSNKYTSYLTYNSDNVYVTNSNGLQFKLELNGDNYLTRLTVDGNVYEFSYSDGRLTRWEKTVYDTSFGQTAYRSGATISYKNGNYERIEYKENNDAPVSYSFTSSDLPNRNGLLPETVHAALGMLGFEHLYYAGMLGKASLNLVQSITTDRTALGGEQETVSFDYHVTRDGDVDLCNYTYQGAPASVRFDYK